MKTIVFFSVLVLICLCVQANSLQTRQEESLSSNVLVRQVTLKEPFYPTAGSAFVSSLASAGVAGGIVRILDCGEEPRDGMGYLPPCYLQEMLDRIVGLAPDYHWEIQDEVVNFLPIQDEPPLLKVRVNSFTLKDAPSVDVALNKLYSLPQVKKAVNDLQLTYGVVIISRLSTPNAAPPKYTIECNDVTVREVLNAIARAHGRAVWEYKERRCNGKTVLTIQFIVQ